MRDLPDIYTLDRGPQAQGHGHTYILYQADPEWPWGMTNIINTSLVSHQKVAKVGRPHHQF